MSRPVPRPLLLAGFCLAAALLACARAEVPINSSGQSVATALVIPPTVTQPVLPLASATSELAEGTAGLATATDAPSATPPPTATPETFFDIVPILNGTFETDLAGWNVTPNWTLWKDGYARLNAAEAGQGAQIVQITSVPQGREVKLHFAARSEDARDGDCVIESHQDKQHRIPADGAWHMVEVDFSLEGGTQTAVSLQARNNENCEWVNLDDVYWLVAASGVSVNQVTPTAEGATPEGPTPEPATPEPSATVDTGPAIPDAIPSNAVFTQDLTVAALGDTPIGAPADLVDGQAITWASLRNGTGAWVFNLGSAQTVAGLRLRAHRDGDQDTTFLGIDVSTDGAAWTEVYRAAGDCGGTTNCQVIAQGTPVDLAFGPTSAQYVRVRSGPTRFAIAEVEVAVIGN